MTAVFKATMNIRDASVGEVLLCSGEIIFTMTKWSRSFVEELLLATCQGMCHEVFCYFYS